MTAAKYIIYQFRILFHMYEGHLSEHHFGIHVNTSFIFEMVHIIIFTLFFINI